MRIPNEFLTDILRDSGIQVKNIGYAVDKVDGLLSNVRAGEIVCKDENSVPDIL